MCQLVSVQNEVITLQYTKLQDKYLTHKYLTQIKWLKMGFLNNIMNLANLRLVNGWCKVVNAL